MASKGIFYDRISRSQTTRISLDRKRRTDRMNGRYRRQFKVGGMMHRFTQSSNSHGEKWYPLQKQV